MAMRSHGGDADAPQVPGDSVSAAAQYVQIRNQILHNDQMNVFFQFVQDNSTQIANNQQAVIHEAEERHRAILGQALDHMNAHFESILRLASDRYNDLERRYLQLESASQSRFQENVSLRDHNQALIARVHEAEGQVVAIKLQFESERDAIVTQGTESIKQAYEEAKRKVDQLRQDHENMMHASDIAHQDEINTLAKQNEDLQLRIDLLERQTSRQDYESQRGRSPRREVAGEDLMPSVDISTPAGSVANPFQESARRMQSELDEYLGPRRAQPEVVGHGTSKDDRKDDHDVASVASPSVRSATNQNEAVLEMLRKVLEKREDHEGRPKAKEAESIKLNNMPTPETYRHWKNHVREEVRAASDKSDKAWTWLMEVWSKKDRAEKVKVLQDPGEFVTLDTKLLAALTRAAQGDLAQRILNYKEEQAMKGLTVRGRYVLLMFDDYFRVSEEAGNLFRLEDLLAVERRGDTLDDLKRFISRWDSVIAGMSPVPEEASLRDIFMRQVRHCPLIHLDVEIYDRAKVDEKTKRADEQEILVKSYDFLYDACKSKLERERLRSNRERIANKNNTRDTKKTGAVVQADDKGKGKGKGKGKWKGRSKSRGRSEERETRQCFEWQKTGKCSRGDKCKFEHGGRRDSPKRTKTRSPSAKRKSKEEMAKIPCVYFQKGKCTRGDKCLYMHAEKATPAAKTEPKAKPKAKATPAKLASATATPAMAMIAKVSGMSTQKQQSKARRRVRFSNRVQFADVPAVGAQRSSRAAARTYTKRWASSDDCPAGNEADVAKAIAEAKKLAESVNAQSSSEPSSRHLATPARGTKSWLVDSGSDLDLISSGDMSAVNATNKRKADESVRLTTANGNIVGTDVVDVNVKGMTESCSPYVLPNTPAVLSLGKRCMEEGYGFIWIPGKEPMLLRPDDQVVKLKLEGLVPVLDDNCPLVSRYDAEAKDILALACRVTGEPEAKLSIAARNRAPDPPEEEGVEEGIGDPEVSDALRSRKSEDLIEEAISAKHLFRHYPKNPFCRVCTRALMTAPQARKKGGQSRVDTRKFGDHIIADFVLIKANVEEGWKGEYVALVVKDLHTQFRAVYPSNTRHSQECCRSILHFVGKNDDVEVIYTDNAPELKAAVRELGYRHQTSIEYIDSTKSFVEREIRQMLEGTRTNLLQAAFPQRYWPLAMQHFACAHNMLPSIGQSTSPWEERFGEAFGDKLVPFGAQVLFWDNPKRPDCTSGKTSPTAVEGVFLGYHIQPGHVWRGEYLVTKLEALEYHLEHASFTIIRVKKVEFPPDGTIFPVRVKVDKDAPKPLPVSERVVPQPEVVPAHPPPETGDDGSVAAVDQGDEGDTGGNEDKSWDLPPRAEPAPPVDGDVVAPDGSRIPSGHHWDSVRAVRDYKGTQRPEGIPSDFWRTLSGKQRQQLIAEEKAAKASSSAGIAVREELPSTWEAIPAHKEAFSLPVVVQKAKQQNVGHRHAFEAVIRERIKELEFQNAVELLASVARLVPKEEIARNPKAQAALDLEWNKLLKKGTWDESRVKECREICKEARDRNEKVHLGRIFEACYEKGSELPEGDPMRKFKGRTVFQGNNVRDEDGMQALFAELGSSPASMEAAKLLDAFGSQPGFAKQQADAVQAYVQCLFKGIPTWLSLPRNRWPKHWEPGNKSSHRCGPLFSTTRHFSFCLSSTLMTSRWQGLKRTCRMVGRPLPML